MLRELYSKIIYSVTVVVVLGSDVVVGLAVVVEVVGCGVVVVDVLTSRHRSDAVLKKK